MYEGVNKLARVMQKRMQDISASPLVLDFGSIQGDYSLKTNTFPIPIPKKDYMVLRQLTLGKKDDVLTKTQYEGKENDGTHGHVNASPGDSAHRHDVLIPEKMRQIKPGDRVLVAWVGNDAVVLDIVLPGTEVK